MLHAPIPRNVPQHHWRGRCKAHRVASHIPWPARRVTGIYGETLGLDDCHRMAVAVAQDVVRARAIPKRRFIADAVLVLGIPALIGKLRIYDDPGKSLVVWHFLILLSLGENARMSLHASRNNWGRRTIDVVVNFPRPRISKFSCLLACRTMARCGERESGSTAR
jgi:hypothetical protein